MTVKIGSRINKMPAINMGEINGKDFFFIFITIICLFTAVHRNYPLLTVIICFYPYMNQAKTIPRATRPVLKGCCFPGRGIMGILSTPGYMNPSKKYTPQKNRTQPRIMTICNYILSFQCVKDSFSQWHTLCSI